MNPVSHLETGLLHAGGRLDYGCYVARRHRALHAASWAASATRHLDAAAAAHPGLPDSAQWGPKLAEKGAKMTKKGA